ncbi:amino acid ABC transporter ATP-binding protein [Selenomonas noxia]|uniref:amino acid ABC transporter ATP-binding protein n=1 Tax=Selenomonas noxia TaxID=135083 RepID=UPI002889BA49|nr:amino acid ABC transporter ATP-binding protein [Selenomonas noxia]
MADTRTDADVMLRMTGICKSFGGLEVLRGIDLSLTRGEVLAIIGPSGSGKSTLLRCINKLETIDRGNITIRGEKLCRTNPGGTTATYASTNDVRRILMSTGMVFQQFNLFPHMTVIENLIEAPCHVKGMKRDEILPYARELLAKVGLVNREDYYPNQLSGGQQQRVAIARALAMRPDIMLFDEPTSALDPELTGEVLRTMRALAAERMTMIVVTHEMAFAREAATDIIFMENGVIVEQGPPAEFFSAPREERTREFLRNML